MSNISDELPSVEWSDEEIVDWVIDNIAPLPLHQFPVPLKTPIDSGFLDCAIIKFDGKGILLKRRQVMRPTQESLKAQYLGLEKD